MNRVLYTAFILLFSILLLSATLFSQTHIPAGKVSGVWQKEKSPYYIDGEIRIPRGKKLNIEHGVKVIFTGHYKLIVNGILYILVYIKLNPHFRCRMLTLYNIISYRYIGLDIDLRKIPIGDNIGFIKFLKGELNFIRLPLPAVRITLGGV